MHIPLCDPVVYSGTTLSVPRSSSETDRVCHCNSSLVNTPSSRMIPGKPKIEVTKDPIHHVCKNGEHFYGENIIYEYPTKRHVKSYQRTGILHTFSNCVIATFNHGLSPQNLTVVIPKENLQKCSSTHQADACSWKLTGEATSSSTTPHVDACSWMLTGEVNS